MNVLDLLSRMGKDAWSACPAVARALADEDASVRQIAITVLVRFLRDPDVQVAGRAALALRQFQNEAEIAVPALIEALQNTNDVGCNAVWSLEWAFPTHADQIIPALRKTPERNDNLSRYARGALKHLESNPSAR